MRIVKQIPNTITSLNLISGAISITFAFKGEFTTAFICMLLASVFDFLDGFAARGLKAYSEIGKELDSLCDTVSFGLAPSFILLNYMLTIPTIPSWLAYTPLLIAVFSALRLAKFNIDTRQSHSFLGLPTPACALLLGAMISYASQNPNFSADLNNCCIIPSITIILSYLLISEHPFLSLKMKNFQWEENKKVFLYFILLIPTIVFSLLLHVTFPGIIMFLLTVYIFWNLLWELFSNIVAKK